MKTRTAAMVVVAIGAIFALGLLGVVILGRVVQGVRERLSTESARQQFVAQWRPPEELSVHAVFPARVAGYAAGDLEAEAKPTTPVLALPGVQATYSQPGVAPIQVFVAQANELEAEAVFQRFREEFSRRSGVATSVSVPGRLRLSGNAPAETVEVWSLQGWLLVFRCPEELDAGFIRSYLVAIAGRSARNL